MAPKTTDDLTREILEVELETKRLGLAKAKKDNAEFQAAEARRHKANTERQANMAQERAMHESNHKTCKHMAGGQAGGNVLKGGGKFAFSVISQALMPDGKTVLLQCPRCRLKLYGRPRNAAEERKLQLAAQSAQKKIDGGQKIEASDHQAIKVWEDHQWWKSLMELADKEGIPDNLLRGPTFVFTKNDSGIPFIPEMR